MDIITPANIENNHARKCKNRQNCKKKLDLNTKLILVFLDLFFFYAIILVCIGFSLILQGGYLQPPSPSLVFLMIQSRTEKLQRMSRVFNQA